MSMTHRLRTLPLLLALAAAGAGSASPAAAQSLLASRGLGYPSQPVDARARGLGGVALGLPGYNLSLVNPAGLAGIPAPTLLVSVQPDHYSATLPGEESSGSTSRFPLIHAAFPIRERWTAGVGYGAFLDQNWAVERSDTLGLGGRRVPVTDRFVSRGGVGRFRVSGSYAASERLAFGAGVDLYSGAARDTLTRSLEGLATAEYGQEWTYSGVGGSVGFGWVPAPALRLSAAVGAGGTLHVGTAGDTAASDRDRSYTLPLTLHAGASGRVSRGALVALSAEWSGWSTAGEELASVGGARDSWTVAGGVELDSPDREGTGTAFPLRAGARHSTLPFRWGSAAEGNAFPTETALTAGFGARLAGGAALADVAGERGWRRGGDAFDESYWRLTLSLTLLGR